MRDLRFLLGSRPQVWRFEKRQERATCPVSFPPLHFTLIPYRARRALRTTRQIACVSTITHTTAFTSPSTSTAPLRHRITFGVKSTHAVILPAVTTVPLVVQAAAILVITPCADFSTPSFTSPALFKRHCWHWTKSSQLPA